MQESLEAIRANCDEVGDCWEWRGAMDGTAPVMRPAGSAKLVPVRRVVMKLAGKKLGTDQFACSKCLNKLCVAPLHAVGLTRTQLQERTAKVTQYGRSTVRRAKLSIASRKRSALTEETVAQMRASGLSTRAAAAAFGCGQSAASDILAGRTWRDLSSPFVGLMGAGR